MESPQDTHQGGGFRQWYNNLTHAGRHGILMAVVVLGTAIIGGSFLNFSSAAYAYTTLYKPNANANATLLACKDAGTGRAPILRMRYTGNDSPFILLRTTFGPRSLTAYNQKLTKYTKDWVWQGTYSIPAGASSVRTALTYDDKTVDASSISLASIVPCGVAATPNSTAPVVMITAPANNAVVSGTTNMLITATDTQGVRSVQLKLNGLNLGSPLTASPFSYNFNTAGHANGVYQITAVATNASGLKTTSASITLTIKNSAPIPLPITSGTPTPTPAPSPTVSNFTTPTPTPAPSSNVKAVVPNTSWDWQIGVSGTVSTANLDRSSNPRKLIDIDVENRTTTEVDALKTKGYTVICYMSAGTYENWRTDAASFPASVLGSKVSGWAGEQWLDVRSPAILTIMETRMDSMATKHCDGVEPDNVDGYTNNPGFPLTTADQITYNSNLAAQAHARGLSVGLKNDVDQVAALANNFDFAVNEQCNQYAECGVYTAFISRNKAVLNAEYSSLNCAATNAVNLDSVLYSLSLDNSKYQSCR